MSLSPNKRSWKFEEDDALRKAVASVQESKKMWQDISQSVTGRSAKQCRERWVFRLSPDINSEPWTFVEDHYILSEHRRIGGKWVEISSGLSGRTSNAVKVRLRGLLRAEVKEWTPVEDLALVNSYIRKRMEWEEIREILPSKEQRSLNAVMSRYEELKKGYKYMAPAHLGSPASTIRALLYPPEIVQKCSDEIRKIFAEAKLAKSRIAPSKQSEEDALEYGMNLLSRKRIREYEIECRA